ncbi:HAMP domain-containing histidine kinase [Streptomyces lunaelactis]|uniref:sensor histidine kinase n=1 Tax=Streptomyces lunaelactis TaxID=1535768 RepID=UPI00158548FB|nr:HAMP domain-containing sensor histidine kinase [Streptomyces lunaelactis]NUK33786.1 HAMP domain-containing histidine kinase [Streptomyces lunaelactis]NUK43145.1 HAMP domain-containing histidine kinase [Streptomyces lunaelactis]NUK56208.1 HAMP domain-containing histidine kinase [Streptomyces lunaelactis]NUK90983.1 HAMP domain-containing histidine kinase [Streptomyces lunaelactis]NUL29095.1 HAMP domain-containing histidine kinase [Streptomyces lunaelactis]
MTPSPRIPWRKSLSVRLLFTSMAIAAVSVGATAWLAVETTTRAIQEERGQVLSDDTDILRQLGGFAATHADWDGVQTLVRTLSRTTDRRIALTTETGHTIADSAAPGTALPARASATVEPLNTDTYTEPGAQLAGIDPRAVGPYLLPPAERAQIKTLAEKRLACMRRYGSDGSSRQSPSGRTVVTSDGGEATVPLQCADGELNTPTRTEMKALDELNALIVSCPDLEQGKGTPLAGAGIDLIPGFDTPASDSGRPLGQTQSCVDSARRTQLDPYVAPRARLFLGSLGRQPTGFNLSPANKAKIVGVTGLVLAVTVAMTAVVAIRLVRPLRALTAAAQQPPQRHARVAVTTKDETGYLAAAFNDLTARREQLEAQRKAMVSDIAHELRTPLTNIRGWLEVTRDGLLPPDPDLIASLHDEALLLQHIIDDLQDLAAVDAGTLRLHREPVGVDELVAQVVSAHRSRAEAAGIRLRTRTTPGLWLEADPVRMRQALGNLVANALRHTPADGTVTLTARQAGDLAVLTVEDTGGGIAPEDLPHVFERFWRAEKSRSRRTGGSGLGLSIVRQLVEAHGGTVTADSPPGAGAAFTVRLPLGPEPDSLSL